MRLCAREAGGGTREKSGRRGLQIATDVGLSPYVYPAQRLSSGTASVSRTVTAASTMRGLARHPDAAKGNLAAAPRPEDTSLRIGSTPSLNVGARFTPPGVLGIHRITVQARWLRSFSLGGARRRLPRRVPLQRFARPVHKAATVRPVVALSVIEVANSVYHLLSAKEQTGARPSRIPNNRSLALRPAPPTASSPLPSLATGPRPLLGLQAPTHTR